MLKLTQSRCLVKQMEKFHPWSYNIVKPPTHGQFREIPIQSTFHVVEFLNSKDHEDFFTRGNLDQKATREDMACRVPRPGNR